MNSSFPKSVLVLVWLGGLVLVSTKPLFAHGDLHERIQVLNAKIAEATNDASLYVQRAELHREHHDWLAAEVDLDRAQLLDRKLVRMDFFRARLAHDMGDLVKARACLDKSLAVVTNNTEALMLRARVRVKLEEATGAVADYSRAIELSREPQPELFLERAELLVAKGQVDEALRGLDEGVKRLGNLITLQTRALDLELSRSNYAGALLRVQAIVASVPRKESWLARQGDILKQAGRETEAKAAWTAALAAINSLPERFRASEEMLELQARLNEALARSLDGSIKPAPAQ